MSGENNRERKTANPQDREQAVLQLQEKIRSCRLCRQRFGYEPRPVTWGSPNAKILHISQAPGRKVHECGRPFSDLSGRTLRNEWYQIDEQTFYNENNFYFTTMGHCFPGKAEGKSRSYDRRPPGCCWSEWTRQEIALMDECSLYLVVGKEAASRLFPGRNLEELVFADLELHGKPCFVLPHPSPLNRRWRMDHPDFEQKRLPQIRQAIREALNEEETDRKKTEESH